MIRIEQNKNIYTSRGLVNLKNQAITLEEAGGRPQVIFGLH
jgi:hypothetical protein